MAVPALASFKPPMNLNAYDGSTDPQEHLEGFRAIILLLGVPDVIMCRAFSTTLKKMGLRWFMGYLRVPFHDFNSWSIYFWHFTTSKAYKKTSASLINVNQGKDKSLKSYLARFNYVALEIKDLP